MEERAAPGRLNQAKLEDEGIAPGPIYGQLKAGMDVTLPNGRVLRAKTYLSSPIPGRKVVILGDTTPCSAIATLASGADVLVHEATYASADEAKAHAHHHSTSVDAATAARESGVKALILTHVSARYDEDALCALLREAQVIFPNTFLASDHASMPILRTGEVKVSTPVPSASRIDPPVSEPTDSREFQ
ncbi:hypothetical protein GCM10025859_36470 [Alicyclobacillus fastidiosus]|nr:hypothetical protein GCM10025859_36470 [Alicyclobacillus fastidiosus]